jgi:hypothetical protein
MVFCEARCRHGVACDVLVAADREHPAQGPYFVHTATDHQRRVVHTWRSRPKTERSTGRCGTISMAPAVTARTGHGP